MADAEEPRHGDVHVLLPCAPVHARVLPGREVATPELDELRLADAPASWRALGFAVGADGSCDVGAVRLRLEGRGAPAPPAGAGEGITEWALRGLAAGVARSLDGLPTRVAAGSARGAPEGSAAHPNGALAVDHVVAATPDLERTFAALAAAGLELRRVRDAGPTARQGFYRVGEAVLEVVGPVRPDGDGPARFWGLVVVVADLDTAVARLGPLVGPPRPAVQPGRRIATVRPAAGLACALALMTPRPLSR